MSDKKKESLVKSSVRDRSDLQRARDLFGKPDTDEMIDDISDFIKKMVIKTIKSLLKVDDDIPYTRNYVNKPSEHRNYTAYSSPSSYSKPTSDTGTIMPGFNYEQLAYNSAADANMVLNAMREQIGEYGFVKVSDYYQYSSHPFTNHQATKYGWNDLNNVHVMRINNNSFVLKLPKAVFLDI